MELLIRGMGAGCSRKYGIWLLTFHYHGVNSRGLSRSKLLTIVHGANNPSHLPNVSFSLRCTILSSNYLQIYDVEDALDPDIDLDPSAFVNGELFFSLFSSAR